MKVLSFFFILFFCFSINAQTTTLFSSAGPFSSEKSLIEFYYKTISCNEEQKTDFSKFENFFLKDANIVILEKPKNYKIANEKNSFTVEEYFNNVKLESSNNGCWVKEVSNQSHSFGGMTHIFSVIEIRKNESDITPVFYILNSFQLVNNGRRLYIVSLHQKIRRAYRNITNRQLVFVGIESHSIADVTNVNLSNDQVNLACPKEKTISVETKVLNEDEDVLVFDYKVSGGKIIGSGEKVVWDLSDVKAGNYTITALVDNGCGFCGKEMTKTVTVVENSDCPK
jgi:hypothetical protein